MQKALVVALLLVLAVAVIAWRLDSPAPAATPVATDAGGLREPGSTGGLREPSTTTSCGMSAAIR